MKSRTTRPNHQRVTLTTMTACHARSHDCPLLIWLVAPINSVVEVPKSCILSLGCATVLFGRRRLASSIGVVLVLYTFLNTSHVMATQALHDCSELPRHSRQGRMDMGQVAEAVSVPLGGHVYFDAALRVVV